jgi:hypothetical protein
MTKVLPSKIVELIDDQFSWARDGTTTALDRQFADRIAALVRLVDEIPAELIRFSGTEYNAFVLAIEGLRSSLRTWDAGTATDHPFHTRVSVQIINLRKSIAQLADQHIPADTPALAFIKDAAFRASLRADIAAAERATESGEWKAATVLGGSVIEALLLWKVDKEPRPKLKAAVSALRTAGTIASYPSDDPNTWELFILIEVAKHMGKITSDTHHVITAARNFRNFIHPGKAIRTQASCDRSTAYNAISGILRVISDVK